MCRAGSPRTVCRRPALVARPAVRSQRLRADAGRATFVCMPVPSESERLRDRLDAAGVAYTGPDRGVRESMYLQDPDGVRIELLSDPLMYFGGRWLDA